MVVVEVVVLDKTRKRRRKLVVVLFKDTWLQLGKNRVELDNNFFIFFSFRRPFFLTKLFSSLLSRWSVLANTGWVNVCQALGGSSGVSREGTPINPYDHVDWLNPEPEPHFNRIQSTLSFINKIKFKIEIETTITGTVGVKVKHNNESESELHSFILTLQYKQQATRPKTQKNEASSDERIKVKKAIFLSASAISN